MEDSRLSKAEGAVDAPRQDGDPRVSRVSGWRRLARSLGTALISVNVLWLGSLGLYSGLSQRVLTWPFLDVETVRTVESPRSFNSETSSMAVVREGSPDRSAGGNPVAVVPEPPIVRATTPAQAAPISLRYAPATQILIPSIDLDSAVVEIGTREEKGELVWETAKWAVGHHIGSANPGQIGNIVLSGHISSPIKKEGEVFKRLPDIEVGAAIVLQTEQRAYLYRVVDKRVVLPTAVEAMAPTATPTLTLITCYPDFIYSHRLVVTALPAYPDTESQ